jgi:cyclic pyranopterin phosphate synthase
MPPEGIAELPRENLLTFKEIVDVAKVFLDLGGRRIRITGGEPLVRKNLVELVQQLAPLQGLEDLALTTNGFHLSPLARPLKEAGLHRINVSLDSLNPIRFARMTSCPKLDVVWEGIQKALAIGLTTKVNVVVMKGINDKEILRFGRLAERFPLEVRFIEFMPLCGTGWHPEWVLPIQEVRALLQLHFSLVPLERGGEVAESYAIRGGRGGVGFIASLSEPFCERCSRMRLTADGKLRSCLFSNQEIDLKPALRSCVSNERQVARLIQEAVRSKPQGHGITYPIQIENPQELPKIRFVGG